MVRSATSCRYALSIVETLSLTIRVHTSATMALCPGPAALPGPPAVEQVAVEQVAVEQVAVVRPPVALAAAVLPPVALAAVAPVPVGRGPVGRGPVAPAVVVPAPAVLAVRRGARPQRRLRCPVSRRVPDQCRRLPAQALGPDHQLPGQRRSSDRQLDSEVPPAVVPVVAAPAVVT